MISWIETIGLWVAVLGCGLMAGVYFAFSAVVMRSLAVIPEESGILAMQSINKVILKTQFIPLFWLTCTLSLALGIWGIYHWSQPGTGWLLLGTPVYLLGMLGCTIGFNIPLNDRLEAMDAKSTEAKELWVEYLKSWTRWNHLRGTASLLSCAIYLQALSLHPIL